MEFAAMNAMRKAPLFQVRKADSNDAVAILDCLEAAFGEYRDQYTEQAYSDTVLDSQTIHHRLREMCVFVAVSDEKIVGTIGCSVHGAEGHLRGMAVFSEWQGTGVASALLQAAEAELIRNGCTYVTLNTTEPLKRAICFYEKHGFSGTGEISDFFGMHLYEYSKPLSSSPESAH